MMRTQAAGAAAEALPVEPGKARRRLATVNGTIQMK